MAYKRQVFINKSETEKGTLLSAEHLKHIENGIVENETNITKLQETVNNLTSARTARIGYVTLLADSWTGEASPYSQIVTIDGVTENTQVDLTPNVAQLAIFHEKDLTFVTENNGGVVTVYAIGQKPINDYTIQVTMTEVTV